MTSKFNFYTSFAGHEILQTSLQKSVSKSARNESQCSSDSSFGRPAPRDVPSRCQEERCHRAGGILTHGSNYFVKKEKCLTCGKVLMNEKSPNVSSRSGKASKRKWEQCQREEHQRHLLRHSPTTLLNDLRLHLLARVLQGGMLETQDQQWGATASGTISRSSSR